MGHPPVRWDSSRSIISATSGVVCEAGHFATLNWSTGVVSKRTVSVKPGTKSKRGISVVPSGSVAGSVVVGATVVDVISAIVVVVDSVAATPEGWVVPGDPSSQPKATAATIAAPAAIHAVRRPLALREGGRNSGSIVIRSSAMVRRRAYFLLVAVGAVVGRQSVGLSRGSE